VPKAPKTPKAMVKSRDLPNIRSSFFSPNIIKIIKKERNVAYFYVNSY